MAAETARRLLLVDDDPLTLSWLRAQLEKAGYHVDTVWSAQTALERIRTSPPDAVILDRVLPDMDGLELCQRIHEATQSSNTKIIIFSVRGSPEDIVSGLNAGADDYIPKARGADAQLIAKLKLLLARGVKPAAAPAPEGKGKIISFFSGKGGSGTTTIAVNTGYALRTLRPKASILLADMVFPLGSIGSMLGFNCPETLAKLSHEVRDRPDRETVARYISQNRPYGLAILPNATDLVEAQNVEVDQILPIFKTLRSMFDLIVIDFGRSLARLTLPVIESSDLIFVIVTPDVNGVGLTRVSLDYFDSHHIPTGRIAVIQNRTVHRSFLGKEEIEKELGRPVALTVPFDGEQVPLATNARVAYLAKFGNTATSMALESIGRFALERLGM